MTLAEFRPSRRGGYDIFARWNDRAKLKQVEHLLCVSQSRLFVDQLCADDELRHACLREIKGWDFVEDTIIAQRKAREPRETVEPFAFSFEEA